MITGSAPGDTGARYLQATMQNIRVAYNRASRPCPFIVQFHSPVQRTGHSATAAMVLIKTASLQLVMAYAKVYCDGLSV